MHNYHSDLQSRASCQRCHRTAGHDLFFAGVSYLTPKSTSMVQGKRNMLRMEYGKMRIAAISIWVATKHLLLFHTFCFRLSNGAKENPTYSYRECKG